ncbi:ATP-grasp domain-containing protein [Infirmifilum sp. SLHALR2]|nr:MAG: hypothetical protein B7L53_05265 [Thermofilum sp. NZ13]
MIPYEFEVKELIRRSGILVEPHCVVDKSKPESLSDCLSSIDPPYVVKAQVRGWGRAKAGLVKFVDSREEAERAVLELMSRAFGGSSVRYVIVSERMNVQKELYLSMMVDYTPPYLLLLASRSGGIDVETQALASGVLKVRINPFEGVREYMARRVAKFLELPVDETHRILEGMYSAVWEYNLHLLELNPLALTDDGIVALDAKAIVDDDALDLNPRLSEIRARYESELSLEENTARKMGFSLILLDGDIAVIGNGAGLTMATMDAVAALGGRPGVFLDLGGGASAERVKTALMLVLSRANIKRVIVNILGGITRCDEVARGAVDALRESGRGDVKVVFRLSGFMEDEGRKILEEQGIRAFRDFEEAVRQVVE